MDQVGTGGNWGDPVVGDLAPFATAFGRIPRLVWGQNVDASIEPIKVRIFPNSGVGGSRFDRGAHGD